MGKENVASLSSIETLTQAQQHAAHRKRHQAGFPVPRTEVSMKFAGIVFAEVVRAMVALAEISLKELQMAEWILERLTRLSR
jgi:hypothetical protein